MGSHVSVQVLRPTERRVTDVTLVRSVSGVHSHVTVQISGLTKCPVTHATDVRFVSRVHPDVVAESSGLTKRLVTQVTFERFVTAVSSAVANELAGRCESSTTKSTSKRFLSRMTLPVYCQGIAALTAFAAFFALVQTYVNIRMRIESTLRRKTAPTLATSIPLFPGISVSDGCQNFV